MELFVFRKGEVADWLQNCKTIIGDRIRFARLARNVSTEKISSHLKLTEQDFSAIENGTFPISENLLAEIMKALLFSRDFLLCESPWLLGEKSAFLSKDDYKNSCISGSVFASRLEELVFLDHINLSSLKKQLTSTEHEGLSGTNNLSHIKKYASILNCSWQYLAGLSPFRWSEDILCKAPQTQPAVLNDTVLNRVKAYYSRFETEQKEKLDEKIGERIRKLREAHSFNQTDIAAYMDISHQALSKFESGETSVINNQHLSKLAEALHCSCEYLLFATNQISGTGIFNLSNQEICYGTLPNDSFLIETSDFLREQNLHRHRNRNNIALSKAFTELIDNGTEQDKKLALDLIKSLLKYIGKRDNIKKT